MSDAVNTANPYEAYFKAMMDLQREMANAYMSSMQNGEVPPQMAMMSPQMGMMSPFSHPAFCHPYAMPQAMAHQYHPAMMPPPNAGYPGTMPPPLQPQQSAPTSESPTNEPFMAQAQAMLDGALGEEAGMFKEILGTFGMNDKEFWKGAMIGAAAALLLSNENVRGKLMGMVSGAGDMLKSGGSSVKDGAMHTATAVKDNVSTGSEIFRDTYAAGKQGFQESVKRHQEVSPTNETQNSDAADEPTVTP